MNWIDIAGIVFICVTVNHLGLVKGVEDLAKTKLIIVNCPKCFTFWATLLYGFSCADSVAHRAVEVLAISFLASYVAIWAELFEGYIDTLYLDLYEKIYADAADDTASSDADDGDSQNSVP